MEDNKNLNNENKQEVTEMKENKFKSWISARVQSVKDHPVKTAAIVVLTGATVAGVIYLKNRFGVELETEELTEEFVEKAEEVVESMSDVKVENF